MTFPLPGANWSYLHSPRLVATTGVNGFMLQNATPNILSWTAPNDGNMHRLIVFATLHVTSSETGGKVLVAQLYGTRWRNGVQQHDSRWHSRRCLRDRCPLLRLC